MPRDSIMKEFIVPAFFIIDAPDAATADEVVINVQKKVNFGSHRTGVSLLIDEKVPMVVMPESWDSVYSVLDVITLVLEDSYVSGID